MTVRLRAVAFYRKLPRASESVVDSIVRFRHVQVVLVLIIALGAAVRWYHIGSASLWTDEFLSLHVASGNGYRYADLPEGVILEANRGARGFHVEGTWGGLIRSLAHSNNPPLYFVTLRLWLAEFGQQNDAILRSLSAFFSVLAVVLAFDAVRLLHGAGPALWAAAILALATPQIVYAQETRAYAMLVALMFACCSAMARIECLGMNRPRLLALLLSAAMMPLTHYLGVSLLVAIALYAALRLPRSARGAVLISLAVGFVATFLIWGDLWWGQLHTFKRTLSWQSDAAPGLIWRLLDRIACLPVRFFVDPGDNPGALAFLGVTLYVVPAILLARDPRLLLWCLILWINVAVIAIGDELRSTMAICIPRYTLPAAAAGTVLAAILLAGLPNGIWRTIAPATLAICCILALPQAYVRYRPDFRALADFLQRDCASDAAVIFYPTANETWYRCILDMGATHYAPRLTQGTIFLSKPCDESLEHQLAARGVIDVVSGSLGPEKILPNCRVIRTSYIPLVGWCSRVTIPKLATGGTETPKKILL